MLFAPRYSGSVKSLGFIRQKWPKRHEFCVEQCRSLHVGELLVLLQDHCLESWLPWIIADRYPNIVIAPDPTYLLSKVYLYIDSEPAPPPVPDWLVELMEQYEAQLTALLDAGDILGYEALLADPVYQDVLAQDSLTAWTV